MVKRSLQQFNQIDPDQSQEWLNNTGKKGGGIVGITKTTIALNRWALSYNFRSHISSEIKNTLGLIRDDNFSHNECSKARQKRDVRDESKLMDTFQDFQLFMDEASKELQSIATKDIISDNITEHLLTVRERGQGQMIK